MRTQKLLDQMQYWTGKYTVLVEYDLVDKETLGEKNKTCRFCGKSFPEVKFSHEAHAIPAAFDNDSLFLNWECNECNSLFGRTIEDHLTKYFLPYRLSAQILGRNSELKYKEDEFNRLVARSGGVTVNQNEAGNIIEILDDHTLRLNLQRQSYKPINVYKGLVKIALSLLPETELHDFENTISWLREDKKAIEDFFGQHVMVRFFPGVRSFMHTKAIIFKRKPDVVDAPAYYFALNFYNFNIQIIVPSFINDSMMEGKTINLQSFPTAFDLIHFPGQIGSDKLDFSGHETVKNEKCPIEMNYESSEGPSA